MQAVQVKKIEGKASSQVRYKLSVSDGEHYMQAMLTTQHNYLVDNGQLAGGSVIEIVEYIVQSMDKGGVKKHILIIMQLKVINSSVPRIGQPRNIMEVASAAAAAPAPAPAAAAAAAPMPGGGPGPGAAPMGSSSYGKAPVQRAPANVRYTAIADLNPYISNWTIKGRVTMKKIQRYSNAKNPDGRILKLEICDKDKQTIQASLFNQDCDRWDPVVQEKKVYAFSQGRVKMANARYNNCSSQYEISLGRESNITEVHDDMSHIVIPYNRTRIDQLATVTLPNTVDVMGVVKSFQPCSEITSKKGMPLTKRDVVLVDETSTEIKMTLWGDHAKMADSSFENNPVLLGKGVSISDFSGRSLSTYRSSQIFFNPEFAEETAKISAWWSAGGATQATNQLTEARSGTKRTIENRKPLSAIADEQLGTNLEKADWVDTKVYINFQRAERFAYPSDPTTKKKLVKDDMTGKWRNERDNTEFAKPTWRYIMSLQVADDSGARWVTAYDEQATTMMGGFKADDLQQIFENGGESAVKAKMQEMMTFRQI